MPGGNYELSLKGKVYDACRNPSDNNTLMFDINGGGYNQLTASSTGCIYYDSTNLTNGNDTTQQLGAGTFIGARMGRPEKAKEFSGVTDKSLGQR